MKTTIVAFAVAVAVAATVWFTTSRAEVRQVSDKNDSSQNDPSDAEHVDRGAGNLETATFGSGCFWCTEAIFQQLRGVHSVVSGYSGGHQANPTYEQVCSGLTGHAEVVQIKFDPELISYTDLLKAFWESHDPTTLNRQGNDIGTQYRSAVFYHTDQQRQLAEQYKAQLDASGKLSGPIVTEITQFEHFYPAEKYHQDYFATNPGQAYCAYVIRPKLEKFRNKFRDKLDDAPNAATTAYQ